MIPLPPEDRKPVLVVESASPVIRDAVEVMAKREEIGVIVTPDLPVEKRRDYNRVRAMDAILLPLALGAGMGITPPWVRPERGKPQSPEESQRQLAAAEAKRQRRAEKRAAVEAKHRKEPDHE